MAHRHLVLVGAGYAHLQVLRGFAASQPADVDISVVWPHSYVVFAPMLAGLITGRYTQADCSVSLAPLLAGSRIRHVQARVKQIDQSAQSITLEDGQTLAYDLLGIDWPSNLDKAAVELAMPGARAHGLFVQPAEGFVKYWPDLAAHAGQSTLHEGLNMAVVGAGMQGVSLAMALQHALPRSRISLVGAAGPAAFDGPSHAQQLAAKALARSGITHIQDACVGIQAHQLLLASGARLRCDAPVVALDAAQFADPGKASFDAAQGPALLAHWRAVLNGRSSKIPATKSGGLNLKELGARNCVAQWGYLVTSGAWVWHWQHVRNQRWIRQLQEGAS
jgi:NADH dehydrogenase FAD-containing subunit